MSASIPKPYPDANGKYPSSSFAERIVFNLQMRVVYNSQPNLIFMSSYSDFRLENWTRGRRPYRLACYKCCTYVYLSECSAYCFYCKNNHSWFRGIYYTITRLCNNWSAILETYNKNNSYNTRFDFQMTYQASKQPRRSLLYSDLIPVASITYAAMSLRPLCNFFQ